MLPPLQLLLQITTFLEGINLADGRFSATLPPNPLPLRAHISRW